MILNKRKIKIKDTGVIMNGLPVYNYWLDNWLLFSTHHEAKDETQLQGIVLDFIVARCYKVEPIYTNIFK